MLDLVLAHIDSMVESPGFRALFLLIYPLTTGPVSPGSYKIPGTFLSVVIAIFSSFVC